MPVAIAVTSAGGLIAVGGIAFLPAAQAALAPEQTLPDPQSVLDDRSPGEREAGALAQTKEAYPMLIDASPLPPIGEAPEDVPKAFAAIIPPEETAIFPDASAPGTPPMTPIILPGETAPTPTFPVRPILSLPAPPPVIFFDSPTAPDTPVTEGPTVPGVPEPGTWATMIVGFLTIGAILRRGARARAAGRPEPA